MNAILGNRASQLCACVESCGKVLGHFLWDPGSMNATISRQPLILFLKVACNTVTYLRSKKIGWMINKWQFCAAKLAESVNYASSAFSEILEIMLVMTNYAKNYASTTYPSLISNERLTKKCLCNRASNNALTKKNPVYILVLEWINDL